MEVSNNNNSVSYGINALKFEDHASKALFEKKNSKIYPGAMKKMLTDIKNIKPKKGPDVDVYVGMTRDNKYTTFTCRKPGKTIRKDPFGIAFQTVQSEDHSPSKITKALRYLMRQVDEYRNL